MKSILISIKPEHCCKILNKDKILEIRTTCPAEWKKYLDGKTNVKPEPCKVYIYETKGKILIGEHFERSKSKENLYFGGKAKYITKKDYYFGKGKVITEFTLNEIDKIEICDPYIFRNNEQEDWKYFEKNACLTSEQMMDYIGYGEDHDGWDKKYDIGYAWHIDDLKIYDKPKELSDFKKKNKCHYTDYEKGCCWETCTFYDLKDCDGKYSKIYKAPNWCYVEKRGYR